MLGNIHIHKYEVKLYYLEVLSKNKNPMVIMWEEKHCKRCNKIEKSKNEYVEFYDELFRDKYIIDLKKLGYQGK